MVVQETLFEHFEQNFNEKLCNISDKTVQLYKYMGYIHFRTFVSNVIVIEYAFQTWY